MMKNNLVVAEGTNIYVAGVYSLSTKDGKVLYIGSGIECNDSLSRHLFNLKRGKYTETNKRPLQEAHDRSDLVFSIIHTSEHANEVKNMNIQQKEDLQKALSVLEQFHIKLNKATVCNAQKSVTKHSSNSYDKKTDTTEKRRIANTGSSNPRAVYDEKLVAHILFFKELGLKPREIIKLMLEHDIELKSSYISRIGMDRWCYLVSECPDWYSDDKLNA